MLQLMGAWSWRGTRLSSAVVEPWTQQPRVVLVVKLHTQRPLF